VKKIAAVWAFPGGFFKEKATPPPPPLTPRPSHSDGEGLTMRLVDRVLRAAFPKDYPFWNTSDRSVWCHMMTMFARMQWLGLAASAAIHYQILSIWMCYLWTRSGSVLTEKFIIQTQQELSFRTEHRMIDWCFCYSVYWCWWRWNGLKFLRKKWQRSY